MNIIDIVIILLILLSGVIGMKRGFFKEIVITIGWIIVFILSFKLKDPLADWLSINLPFFNFGGVFKDVTVINIILYQLIAFLIIYSIIMIIFSVIVSFTGLFEKLLNITIILAIPSKILGFIVGLLEGYFLIFIALFILTQPMFNIGIINDSKLKTTILESTPVFGSMVKNTSNAINDIYVLTEESNYKYDKNEFNKEAINIMLKYKLIKTNYVQKLADAGKIKVNGISEVIDRYR